MMSPTTSTKTPSNALRARANRISMSEAMEKMSLGDGEWGAVMKDFLRLRDRVLPLLAGMDLEEGWHLEIRVAPELGHSIGFAQKVQD